MSTATEGRPFTPRVSEALADSASRIAGSFSAQRLWERHLTVQDRERLGGDCRAAYKRLGTAGMWSKLRGVTPYRAVVDVANKLDLLSDSDREWLLREIGEDVDAEEAKLTAIANGDLVVVETPREAYWNGNEIEIDLARSGISSGNSFAAPRRDDRSTRLPSAMTLIATLLPSKSRVCASCQTFRSNW